jgi:hypothetical protein
MINYLEIEQAKEEIEEKRFGILYGDLSDEDIDNYSSDIQALEDDIRTWEAEQEEYREGYDAGREFHMSGAPMRDEWQGRGGKFYDGFTAAGQDS